MRHALAARNLSGVRSNICLSVYVTEPRKVLKTFRPRALQIHARPDCGIILARQSSCRQEQQKLMWDAKRQAIWLAAALILGTLYIYSVARDDAGRFDPQGFAFMEVALLFITAILFFIYSRRKG